jgi:hypothetical protein
MSIEEKAGRLLLEGRVRIVEAGHGHNGRARVKGDHGEYDVEFAVGAVVCHCPAWVRRCSHAEAVARVVEVSP